MPTVRTAGGEIYYERAGRGRPVLNIGVTGGDLRRSPSPLAWPGAVRFDQVAYDHRGFGRSRASDPDAQPTMADFAADALAVADAVGWVSFAVVGSSFGGMVAQEVAILAPARVSRLVLACTSSGGAGGASAPLHELSALPGNVRAERILDLVDIRAREDRDLRAQLAAERAAVPPPDDRLRRATDRLLEARRWHDTWDRLHMVRAPTLVLAGLYDAVAPVVNAQALACAIPGAELAVFEGGHDFLKQDAAAWPRVAEFLGE